MPSQWEWLRESGGAAKIAEMLKDSPSGADMDKAKVIWAEQPLVATAVVKLIPPDVLALILSDRAELAADREKAGTE